RPLDEVGGRPLQRGVGRHALAERAVIEVLVVDLGDEAPASGEGLDVTELPCVLDAAIEVAAYARESAEVLLDELLRLVLGDIELLGEGEGPLAVDGAEIDGLGAGSLLGGDLRLGDPEDQRGGLAVDVAPGAEGIDELLVLGEMRQEPELDL